MGIVVNAVGDEVVVQTRDVDGAAVGEVTAVSEVHTENGIAGLEQCEVNGGVSLCAGVRLNVYEFGTEQLLCAFDCDIFGDVYLFTAAVVTLARITFGVLIGENGAHSRHNGFGNNVFGSDQLDTALLAVKLREDGIADLGVDGAQEVHTFVDHLYSPCDVNLIIIYYNTD